MNVVCITGNLGADPERIQTRDGKPMTAFRMAVPNPYSKDAPDWVNVKVFGASAEPVARIAHKGMTVGVSGRLSISRYEKDGATRESVAVIADRVDFLHSRDQDVPRDYEQASGGQRQPPRERPMPPAQRAYSKAGELPIPPAPDKGYEDDGDVPF